jgi:hypothetical protein
MPRLPFVGAPLAIAILLSASLVAQKSATGSPHVRAVVVRGSGDATEIEIQTSGTPVAPDTQVITGPDRIVVDFPGALPSPDLRALTVNSGALKGVRSGLFLNDPPTTRVVLDLTEPRSYQISTTQNAIVLKLGPAKPSPTTAAAPKPAVATAPNVPPPAPRLQNASLAGNTNVAHIVAPSIVAPTVGPIAAPVKVSSAVANATAPLQPADNNNIEAPAPPKPLVTVTFENGMLRIHAEKATLAQVLFEVQRQTKAEIAIPAGAEQEKVAVDLGPAASRDVLAALLNGSPYNFIFVGNELSLERVILTRRDSSIF